MTSQLHPFVVHFSVGLILAGIVLFFLGAAAWPADTGTCFALERGSS